MVNERTHHRLREYYDCIVEDFQDLLWNMNKLKEMLEDLQKTTDKKEMKYKTEMIKVYVRNMEKTYGNV